MDQNQCTIQYSIVQHMHILLCTWTQVVCRQLGYNGTAKAFINAAFGPGNGTIWMSQVFCSGSESSLDQCPFNGWGINNCWHGEDAGVVCQGTDSPSEQHSNLPFPSPSLSSPSSPFYPQPSSFFHLGSVQPAAPIRLVGGSTPNRGRVEVQYNGVWGTVCDDTWDINDATVREGGRQGGREGGREGGRDGGTNKNTVIGKECM